MDGANHQEQVRVIVAIVGSRNFPDPYKAVGDLIGNWEQDYNPKVISGGAQGVDTAARAMARQYGLEFEEYAADWAKNGKAAGYLRNDDMVRAADIVIAFWDGESKGTKHTIDLALKHRKHLEVHFP